MLQADGLARIPMGEILRFGLVGLAATATHFLMLTGAVEVLGLPAAPANGLAFCVAVCVTYLGQSLWVFRQTDHSARRFAKFLTIALGGLVANVAIMALAVDALRLHYHVGFVAALLLVPACTYLVNKFWVFRRARNG